MLLSNVDILKAYDQGAIYFVSPGHENQRERLIELLSHNSIDVTLGAEYLDVYGNDSYDVDRSNDKVERIHYKEAKKSSLLSKLDFFTQEYVGETSPLYLDPSSFYLAHTHEFIGTTDKPYMYERKLKVVNKTTGETEEQVITEELYLVPMFETKSTIARMGASMHLGAGFGDFGFHGRWAMEISPAVPLTLNFGDKVAQISFQALSSKPNTTYNSDYSQVEDWSFDKCVLPRNGYKFERLYI